MRMRNVYSCTIILLVLSLGITPITAQSFISVGFGVGIQAGQPAQFYEYDEANVSRSSFNTNIEAAFFSNPYIGFGGSFLISNRSAYIRGMFGPYINIPIGDKVSLQGKVLFGWLNGACCPGIGFLNLSGGNGDAGYTFSIPITGYATGISIKHNIADAVAVGVSVDYTSEFSSTIPNDPNFNGYIPVRYITTAIEIAYIIH